MDTDMRISESVDEKLERLYPVFSCIPDRIELMEDDIPIESDYLGGGYSTSQPPFLCPSNSISMDTGVIVRPGTPIDMSMYSIKEHFEETQNDMILNLEGYRPSAPQIMGQPKMPVYNCPKPYNSTARDIWLESGLRESATLIEMEYYLSDWLTRNEYIKHRADGRHKLEWVGKNGTRYKTTWDIFMKWMMISCIGEIPA
jgi:hypothetical protein